MPEYPALKVTIKNEVDETIEGLIGPFAAGSKVVLRCDAIGGHPRPKVIWLRKDKIVDDESETLRKQLTSNFLTLSNLTREDLFAEFTCRATNSEFTAPITSSVTIDMIYPPLELHLTWGGPTHREGTVSNLMCETRGSRPTAEISWWIDGVKITNTVSKQTYTDGIMSRSTLGLVVRMEDDQKNILCRAQNPILPSAVLESSRKLTVLYAPRTVLKPGVDLNIDEIKEGDDIFFECEVKANPKVKKVHWYFHESKRLTHNVSNGVIESNYSLVLQNVKKEASGAYICIAWNEYGRGISSPLILRVKFSPICITRDPKILAAQKNERITVFCDILADPSPHQFQWAFNTSTEIVDMTWFKGQIGQEVSYTPRSDLDFGSLLCWGNNAIGTQRDPCVIHVIHAGIPSPVKNCTVFNITSSSVSVECLPGWDGGIEQSFTIQVLEKVKDRDALKLFHHSTEKKGSNTGKVYIQKTYSKEKENYRVNTEGRGVPLVLAKTATSPNPLFIVEGLEGGKTYLVSVRAVNAKGQSGENILKIQTVEEKKLKSILKESNSASFRVTPLIATAITVFGCFSLIFLIMSALIWKRKKILKDRSTVDLTLNDKSTDTSDSEQKSDIPPEEEDTGAPDIIRASKIDEISDNNLSSVQLLKTNSTNTSLPSYDLSTFKPPEAQILNPSRSFEMELIYQRPLIPPFEYQNELIEESETSKTEQYPSPSAACDLPCMDYLYEASSFLHDTTQSIKIPSVSLVVSPPTRPTNISMHAKQSWKHRKWEKPCQNLPKSNSSGIFTSISSNPNLDKK